MRRNTIIYFSFPPHYPLQKCKGGSTFPFILHTSLNSFFHHPFTKPKAHTHFLLLLLLLLQPVCMSVSEAMSEASEEVGSETKRVINPRVEIDTSPPFGSVQEAVTHFGGSGSWIPLHLLRLAPPPLPPPRPHDQLRTENLDMEKKINEQAAELERYLISRERETLAVLKQLEETKRFVEDVKLKLSEQSLDRLDRPSPGLIFVELNQAKLNLNKTTDDLALLRASVDSLSQNVTRKPQPPKISSNEQVKNMAEAARYEVMKAMAEIEQTKTSITVVEMRLVAARKMEEAAKAVEAIACAESTHKIMGFSRKVDEGYVSLSIEEYSSLTQKAREAEEGRLRRKTGEDLQQAFRAMKETESNFSRSTISMGDVLNQKKKKKQLIVQDDMVVEKHIQQVSLSQMLREQSGLILQHQSKTVRDETISNNSNSCSSSTNGHGHRHFFAQQKKKFGFVDIALPLARRNKKKMQQQQ